MDVPGRGRQGRWPGSRLLQIPFPSINNNNDSKIGVCNVKENLQDWKQSLVLPWDDGESPPPGYKQKFYIYIVSKGLLAMIFSETWENIDHFLEFVELSNSFKLQFQFICSDTLFLEFALPHPACPT